jgi:7-carboxy-7-deazaguanine synthase
VFTAIANTRFTVVNGWIRLCDQGYQVSLETSGAIDISRVDQRVSRVLDIKTPDSGEVDRNLWENLDVLSTHDQVKFVICSQQDYDWAVAEIRSRGLEGNFEILVSPAWGQQDAEKLAHWVLRDQLAVRVQLQLHKILWGDVPGK